MPRNGLTVKFKSEKGASSVLVVLVLVVLVALGLSALTTSLSALRLGNRSGDWISDYYIMDDLAGENLAAIDGAIFTARGKSEQYMNDGTFRKSQSSIDEQLQQRVKADWDDNGDRSRNRIEKMVFFYFLNETLGEKDITLNKNGLDGSLIVSSYSDAYVPVIGFIVNSPNHTGTMLLVEIEIYGIKNGKRFGITAWVEKQGNR